MSNLSNLYISQSFFGVVNLENSLEGLSSASGDTQLQDGLGENLGIIINSGSNTITLDRNVEVTGNLIVSGNAEFDGNVDFSGSITHTGSLDVLGDITASGNIKATIGNFDTVNTRVLHVTEESASVIFSSGSNILGDEAGDVQTLNGTVNIPNVEFLAGNAVDTNTRINNLNSFTSSQEVINIAYNAFTASVTQSITDISASFDTTITNLSSSVEVGQLVQDGRLNNLESFTGSFSTDFIERPEFNTYTSSITVEQNAQDARLTTIEIITASIEVEQNVQNNALSNLEAETASMQTEIDGLSNDTGSYAKLAENNTFTENQIFSGSVAGEVITVPIVSLVATVNCSLGNFFKLTLAASANTDIQATNIVPGLTTTVEIKQPVGGVGTVTFNNSSFSFPRFSQPIITAVAEAKDIATFVSFDSTKLNGALTNDLI